MASTSPRAKSAPTPTVASALPPLLDSVRIERDLLGGVLGRDRVRQALAHSSAPKPILGGIKGSTPIWGRDSIISYFERIAKDGWPTGDAA